MAEPVRKSGENMTPDALILFFKYPERGRVKTRIAASLGEDFALGLYAAFIQDILAMSASVGADKIIVTDVQGGLPPHGLDMGTGYRTLRQKGGDIGIRMLNAFLQVFDMGYHRAVLIGGDCPDLPAEFIHRSLNALIPHDVVLGKSMDGGYYLIGLKSETCAAEFFIGIPWSTSWVFRKTADKVLESGKSLYLLPEWQDTDEKDDLARFDTEKSPKDISLYTAEFLRRNLMNR